MSNGHHRICIVGLGVHGTGIAGRLLENPGRFELAAVVDASVASFMRFRSRYPNVRVPFYRNVAEAAEAEPDGYFVATPAPAHVSAAQQIIEGGFSGSILIEKPVSNAVSEVDRLLGWLHERAFRGRVTVDFHRRCAGIYQHMERVVRAGELGALVEMEFVRPCKLSMNGAHFADLGNWYAASQPVSVRAELDEHSSIDHRGATFFDPPGSVEVTYESGVRFKLETRQQPATGRPFGMRVRLERGELFIDDEESFLEIRTPKGTEKLPSDKVQFGYNWIETTLLSTLEPTTGFTPCSLTEARDALAVIVAAHLSHQRGRQPVALPLDEPARHLALRVA
jgi:predicted dehydrogenase